jgi:hypothetical protein
VVEVAFWENYVVKDQPPPSKKLTLKFDQSNGKEQ